MSFNIRRITRMPYHIGAYLHNRREIRVLIKNDIIASGRACIFPVWNEETQDYQQRLSLTPVSPAAEITFTPGPENSDGVYTYQIGPNPDRVYSFDVDAMRKLFESPEGSRPFPPIPPAI
jgi:hypothetical protein